MVALSANASDKSNRYGHHSSDTYDYNQAAWGVAQDAMPLESVYPYDGDFVATDWVQNDVHQDTWRYDDTDTTLLNGMHLYNEHPASPFSNGHQALQNDLSYATTIIPDDHTAYDDGIDPPHWSDTATYCRTNGTSSWDQYDGSSTLERVNGSSGFLLEADESDEMINELINQPVDIQFNMPAYDADAHSQMALNGQEDDDSEYTWPPLPSFKWQYNLLKPQVTMIHKGITDAWPKYVMTDSTIKKELHRVSKWLDMHPEIVAELLKDNQRAWQLVLRRCTPDLDKILDAGEKKPRQRKLHMAEPIWLARPILSSKRDKIIKRLAKHWKGSTESNVLARLTMYVDKFSKISSPEPLLEDDDFRFRLAADAIFCEDAPQGYRHVGASDEDLLHQYSPEYSVSLEGQEGKAAKIPREVMKFSVKAARLRTGHSWLNTMTPIEAHEVHKLIRGFWKDRIEHKVLTNAFEDVNEYLENDREILERIREGDRSAAFQVAKMCMKPALMKEML